MNSEPTRSQELSEKGSPYDGASSASNDNSNNNSNNNSNDNEKSAVVVKSQDDQDEASSTSVSDVFDVKQFDPVLARKMALVNQAIDEIGMTSFQWNLFWLNGFGYTVDSLLVVCQSIANPAVQQEYGNPSAHVSGIPLASQIGLLVGAGLWGFTADIIGRKLAFNTSLMSCAVFVLIAGAMPSYISFATIVALYSAGAGGNYILDATNFLEFLPTTHAWLVTFMAVWWAVGYTITGLLAWAFMGNFSCAPDATPETCSRADNMGWRYLHFTCGGLVLIMAIARFALVRMVQTPRWLIAQNRDEEVIKTLNGISLKAGKSHSLTLEQLQAEGIVLHTQESAWSATRLKMHFKGLFQTRQLAWSTTVIIANWFVIGMVSPLYSVFLPFYLASRGADFGESSTYLTWRDYAINQVAGLVGPVIAAVLVETKFLGRRGTLAIGALTTMVLQFGYTQVKNEVQNVGVSAAISAASNIYYGTIYAYTPEILPSAHRATGYGICVVLNRVGGILGVLVGSYANVETTAPLFVCAALFGLLVILSVILPFESMGKRSV
ncbi:major facilitator superfamily domain-containing protein [Trichoderma breve]|uniref:Major facilitator superfamily domain-containing protein n=1 Tax=Trichoderma breve TaxID=2034170 RepID=A0A9W9JS30_9HYPO|nr:major facilitator superfamily domain-containing protein [Trichoderma breve]KAJ4864017.1 major facilitator superfamily domain-containing protein [Trichoderma breve]